MKENIYITGASGFIGRNLSSTLSQEGILYSRLPYETLLISNIEELKESLGDADVFIHLASAVSNDAAELTTDKTMIEKLIEISESINKPHKIIFSSSFSVYEPQKKVLTEDSPTEPNNNYGNTKLMCERSLLESNLSNAQIFILRISNVYGPGMPAESHSVVSNFADAILKDRSLRLNGDGKQNRDFIYIDDVTQAIKGILRLQTEEGTGDTFNLCSGNTTTLIELISQLEQITGKKAEIVFQNPHLSEDSNWEGDNTKLRGLLKDWKIEYPLVKGLEKTIKKL